MNPLWLLLIIPGVMMLGASVGIMALILVQAGDDDE